MAAVHYLETKSVDPYYNLAFEDYVLTHRMQGDYLILWQNANTIVIGRNQNAEAEINRPFVEAHGITVARRGTGGGAVYHDLGNLNYSFITDAGPDEALSMARFTAPVVKALQGLCLTAEASGRNDILVNGRKVSGTAQRLYKSRILHHGTLLFDSDPSLVAGALNVDPSKFEGKSAKSVRARIGNIRPCLKQDMDMPAFIAYLKQALAQDGLTPDALTAEELESVMQLRDTKYATWEWNFGASPRFALKNKRRWPGGTLEVQANVQNGILQQVMFYGDFLALAPLDGVREALAGVPFRREAVAEVLQRFELNQCFGSITQGEILDTLFYAGAAE